MTTQIGGPWTLFEFVGGPHDGELRACSMIELDALLHDHLLRSNPVHLSADASWQLAAEQATTQFGRGEPNAYARLLWQGNSFDPPHHRDDELTNLITSQRERMEHALLAGEHHEADLIAAAFFAHTPSETRLIESLLAPAMRSIGDRWADGSVPVYDEHRAYAIVHSILGDYSAATGHVAGLRAAVTTVADEYHSLPARMAAVALREDGWQVEEVTGALPAGELVDTVAARRLNLVVLSATLDAARETALEIERQLADHGIPVLVGEQNQSLLELQRLARRVSLSA